MSTEVIRIGRCTRHVTKNPCCSCCSTCCVVFVLSILGLSSVVSLPLPLLKHVKVFADVELTQFVPALDNRHSAVVQEFRGFSAAKKDRYRGPSFPSQQPANETASDSDGRQRSTSTLIVYDAMNGDIFTPEAIEAMTTFEAGLLANDEYDDFCERSASQLSNSSATACASPQTILNYLYVSPASHEAQCLAGFCAAPSQLVDSLCGVHPQHPWGTFPCVSQIYDWRDGTLLPQSAWHGALADSLCTPTETAALAEFLLPVVANCSATATFLSTSSRYARSAYTTEADSVDIGKTKSVGRRRFWRLFEREHASYTEQLVQALVDGTEAVSATPYRARKVAATGRAAKPLTVLWSCQFSSSFQTYAVPDLMLALYSVLVIVVIVLLHTRSIVFTFAGMFEIIFSVPLAIFVWLLVGQRVVDAMQLLGLFLVLCIGADDIFVFVDTWKEAAVMPPHISGTYATRFSWAYRRAAGTMLATTLTTSISLLLNALSPYAIIAGFGIFNAIVIAADYLQVITWFAAVGLIRSMGCAKAEGGEALGTKAINMEGKPTSRKSTAWLRDVGAPLLYRSRWPLVVISTAMMVGGVYGAFALYREPEDSVQPFPSDHPVTQLGSIQSLNFASDDDSYGVSVVYGMASPAAVVFPSNGQIYLEAQDAYLEGMVPQYNETFAWTPQVQQAIVADCEAAIADASLVLNGGAYCYLNEVARWAGPSRFPYPDEVRLRDGLEAFYLSDHRKALSINHSGWAGATNFVPDGADGVLMLYNRFNMTLARGTPLSPHAIRPYFEPWEAFCTSRGCFATTRSFYIMDTLKGVAESALINVFIAVGASCVVLIIVTGNVFIPLFATVSITSTVAWTLLTIFALGYDFDVFAAILVVMVVGLAVDYSVHFSHFYKISTGTRYERTQAAMHGVGLSISAGALTTFGAALPLLAAQLRFFLLAGLFVLLVAVFGFFFAVFQLLPLLMALGPEGKSGELWTLCERRRAHQADNAIGAAKMSTA